LELKIKSNLLTKVCPICQNVHYVSNSDENKIIGDVQICQNCVNLVENASLQALTKVEQEATKKRLIEEKKASLKIIAEKEKVLAEWKKQLQVIASARYIIDQKGRVYHLKIENQIFIEEPFTKQSVEVSEKDLFKLMASSMFLFYAFYKPELSLDEIKEIEKNPKEALEKLEAQKKLKYSTFKGKTHVVSKKLFNELESEIEVKT
jgi:DNA-directed RNA polymerase subunit M/transcription elongation factor TFIIS